MFVENGWLVCDDLRANPEWLLKLVKRVDGGKWLAVSEEIWQIRFYYEKKIK